MTNFGLHLTISMTSHEFFTESRALLIDWNTLAGQTCTKMNKHDWIQWLKSKRTWFIVSSFFSQCILPISWNRQRGALQLSWYSWPEVWTRGNHHWRQKTRFEVEKVKPRFTIFSACYKRWSQLVIARVNLNVCSHCKERRRFDACLYLVVFGPYILNIHMYILRSWLKNISS